jgi:hypothetical protein
MDMATDNTQLLEELNRKLDAVAEISREAKAQGEAIQDLLQDLSLVSNSAVFSLHETLDLENVHVDGRDVRELMVLTLKNIRNFNAALSQLEAITELGRETSSTGQKLIMDFSRRVGELEEKGYFEHGQKAIQAMDSLVRNLPGDTFERMENAAPELAKLTDELSDPREIARMRKLVQNRKLLIPGLAAAWLIPVALLVANLFV